MTVQINVPAMGESITEATVAGWKKKEGDFVEADELLAELETDKVNLEVVAPKAGKLVKIVAATGATVSVGDLMGEIDEAAAAGAAKADSAKVEKAPATAPKAAAAADTLAPSVRKLVTENNINPADVSGSGRDGRLTKGDVLAHMDGGAKAPAAVAAPAATPAQAPAKPRVAGEREERVPMTALRKTIARRLKEAQNTAAMLTTFNEVDLTEVMALRKQYKDMFKEKHGVGLGFMSFFTKAVVEALKEIPALNAEITGDEIIYKHYYDIGIAVSAPRGLVVPVIRDADKLTFAGIEQAIADYAAKAKANKLMPEDMSGGSFTITNGGVFGSMMSTPILNSPQVGILGMHAIMERPMVVNGEIKVRPMMYLALSYDHRIVDGREAVTFLVKIKEALQDPARLMLNV
jgi:2-oxoglutarate dehydrogenase E2 component (dihydrolipoamide succinyltransferase)